MILRINYYLKITFFLVSLPILSVCLFETNVVFLITIKVLFVLLAIVLFFFSLFLTFK